jgi:hypothetical protein
VHHRERSPGAPAALIDLAPIDSRHLGPTPTDARIDRCRVPYPAVRFASRAAAAGIVGLLATIALPPPSASSQVSSPAVVYGDSVATEGKAVLAQQLSAANQGSPVIARTYPGTALCDWIPSMISRDGALAPRLVVVMFSGTLNRPCVSGRGDDTGSWATDLRAVVSYWVQRGTRVLLVGLPGMVSGTPPAPLAATGPSFPARSIAAIEASIASGGNPLVRYVDAGRVFVGHDGRYDQYLPCLPTEGPAQGCGVAPAPTGEIEVRDADREHFCVVAGLSAAEACPVYSSGVVRLAEVVAQATEGWMLPTPVVTPQQAAVYAQLSGMLAASWSRLMP